MTHVAWRRLRDAQQMVLPTFNAPGPGQWALDRSHVPGGSTPIVRELMSRSMPPGMRRVFAELGAPLDTLDVRFVNGFMYTRLRPLIAPDKPAKRLPPLPLLKLVSRCHPEFRRRARTAAVVLAERPWRTVVHEWENGGRAVVEQSNLLLQDVDLSMLTDAEVADHVRRVFDHCVKYWEHHFWMHGYDLGPIGRFLYECRGWGLEPSEVIPLLEGASPSTSEPARRLLSIRTQVEASGTVPTTIDELRAISPQVSDDLDEYLRYRGSLLFSRYDVDGVTLNEVPDLVLASVLNAAPRDVGTEIARRIAAARERVRPEARATFDEVITEARAAMNLRDDNGPTTAEWPLGLLRYALMELGRRLVAAGRTADAVDGLELDIDEIHPAMFAQDTRFRDGELAERRANRWAQRQADAPNLLGPAEPAPPTHVLPGVLPTLVGMVQIVVEQMGMDGKVNVNGLSGAGVGTETYRGRARRANTPEEALDRLEPGDVLVVPCTTPAYNLVLSLAGAVVTADGGPLSHAAVIARELGIPAVVGARTALTDIPDGALVEVDPVAGVVRELSAT